MWRFILVTFGFLGFAFYELSGGADYRPSDDSLQAHMERERESEELRQLAKAKAEEFQTLRTARAEPAADASAGQSEPSTPDVDAQSIDAALVAALEEEKGQSVTASTTGTTESQQAQQPELVTTAVIGLEELTQRSSGGDVQVTLTSAGDGFGGLGATLEMSERSQTATDEVAATTQVAIADSAAPDMRQVTGNLVNMRAGPGTSYGRLDQLRQGDRVRVLEDLGNGWLRLRVEDTGREGYMADWLVTAAN